MRIGIDVGGTNTDAVLMEDSTVVGWCKQPTTRDVSGGIIAALEELLEKTGVPTDRITGVMVGTTHFTNTLVERQRLMPVAAIRLALPATSGLPPMIDWPADLRAAMGEHVSLLAGGHEYDGRPIAAGWSDVFRVSD